MGAMRGAVQLLSLLLVVGLGMSAPASPTPHPQPQPRPLQSLTTSTSGPQVPDNSLPPVPTEAFPRSAQLDAKGDYFLFWRANATHVTFETHVRTHGYVGFGLSANGNMFPADVVIGWVKDRKTFFQDRHSVGYNEPIIDDHQDWFLLHGAHSDFGTVLKFVRKLDTCDVTQDRKIESGTTKVIFSWHPDTPQLTTGLPYHGGERRGTKSLHLLDPPQDTNSLPPDTFQVDFTSQKFQVPAKDTTYHCSTHRLPSLHGKHHLVMFEPLIQAGHENIVHHILVYQCPSDPGSKFDNMEYTCYSASPKELNQCLNMFMGWAVGGEAYYLPEEAGIPLGTSEDPSFFVMEVHYNNHELHADYVDSSGMRLHLTPTLRKHDAGMLVTGSSVSHFMLIPPHFPDLTVRGWCSPTCLDKDLKQGSIKVIGGFLHSHLIGIKMVTRHFRNGTELPPIIADENYDFDFQEFRSLPHEVTVQAGDILATDCVFKSTERSNLTEGGLSTRDEMCLGILIYYPRGNTSWCVSLPLYTHDHIDWPAVRTHQAQMALYVEQTDWTQLDKRQHFQNLTSTGIHVMSCGSKGAFTSELHYPFNIPPYTPPASNCPAH